MATTQTKPLSAEERLLDGYRLDERELARHID